MDSKESKRQKLQGLLSGQPSGAFFAYVKGKTDTAKIEKWKYENPNGRFFEVVYNRTPD